MKVKLLNQIKLVNKHYLEGPVEKASKAPNGKQIIISNGKATLQR